MSNSCSSGQMKRGKVILFSWGVALPLAICLVGIAFYILEHPHLPTKLECFFGVLFFVAAAAISMITTIVVSIIYVRRYKLDICVFVLIGLLLLYAWSIARAFILVFA
jgi:hypothetical protein